MSKPTERKPVVRIRNSFFGHGSLHGNVVDHPRFPEGYFVTTSEVLEHYKEDDIVETRNTIYVLLNDEE